MNNENLKPFTSNQSREEAVKNGAKGGKVSGEARRHKRTVREIAEILDTLPVTGANKDKLVALGVPEDLQTQDTLRLVALQGKAVRGDVQAVKLWLEIIEEAPTQKVEVHTSDDKTRKAYERAAAAIKGTRD